eukprot:2830837-Pyramimonas_sp.AAC.1
MFALGGGGGKDSAPTSFLSLPLSPFFPHTARPCEVTVRSRRMFCPRACNRIFVGLRGQSPIFDVPVAV